MDNETHLALEDMAIRIASTDKVTAQFIFMAVVAGYLKHYTFDEIDSQMNEMRQWEADRLSGGSSESSPSGTIFQ